MINHICRKLKKGWNRVAQDLLLRKALWQFGDRWRKKNLSKTHQLPAQLIVSLTSFPARFGTLPLTLKCLLSQTVEADRIILWIAEKDRNKLTLEINNLKKVGLEILFCEDWKSYKKIIPTLKIAPNAFIVTADDDLYYWPTWLEELINEYTGDDKEVLCHRARLIRLDDSDQLLPYQHWDLESKYRKSSHLIFPTGVGGVFYPPNVFFHEVLNIELFRALCPRADDVWLYWMVLMGGGKARKIGGNRPLICWPNSQDKTLWRTNVLGGGNDKQIKLMTAHFGLPKIKESQ